MAAERDRSQPQARRPPFRALVQSGCSSVGQSGAGRSEQFSRLGLAEPEVGGADLGDFAGETELVQRDPRIPACRQDDVRGAGEIRHQAPELGERVGRPQLVEV